MSSLASPPSSATLPLATLTADQVAELVPRALPGSCACFAEAIAAGTNMDGAALAALTSGRLVRKSPLANVCTGDRVAHSLFSKEIRELVAHGVPQHDPEAEAEAEATGGGWSGPPGDLEAPPCWDTMSAAKVSDDGAVGVAFCRTTAGNYVIKPGGAPSAWREAFAFQLAVKLGMPAPRFRVLARSDPEYKLVFKGLWRLSTSDVDLKFRLWKKWKDAPFLFVMEFVQDAQLLAGCGSVRAATIFNPEDNTSDSGYGGGAKRLQQLGWLLCVDALCNNQDRIPVVHSNVGNGNNVMISAGGTGDIVAIDGTVQPFGLRAKLRQGSSGSRLTVELFERYAKRVRTWLCACLGVPLPDGEGESKEAAGVAAAAAVKNDEEGNGDKKGMSLREKTILSLQTEYAVDLELAEACVEAAQFDMGSAWMFASSPTLRDYAQRRGAGSGGACGAGGVGSLVCVRDFCNVMTGGGCDIGERGCELVREGVIAAAQAIASKLTTAGLEEVYAHTAGMVVAKDGAMRSSLKRNPWDDGSRCELEFLIVMANIFREVVALAEEGGIGGDAAGQKVRKQFRKHMTEDGQHAYYEDLATGMTQWELPEGAEVVEQ